MSPDAFFDLVSAQATDWINVFTAWVRSLPVSFALGAGMVATVNPCGFIMLPSFAAFYLATDDGERRPLASRLLRAGQMGLLVSVAFVAVFGLFGLAVTVAGRQLIGWTYWAGLAIGLALIAFGAYQLITRRTLFAELTSSVRVSRSRTMLGVLTFGMAYAVVSLGCTLPIFMLVVGSVFTGDGGYLASTWRFVEYGVGMGMVLMVVAVGVAMARTPVMRFAGVAMPYISGAANLALIFAGAYVTWYWWKALAL